MAADASASDLLQDLRQLSEPGRVRYLALLSQEQKDAVLIGVLRADDVAKEEAMQATQIIVANAQTAGAQTAGAQILGAPATSAPIVGVHSSNRGGNQTVRENPDFPTDSSQQIHRAPRKRGRYNHANKTPTKVAKLPYKIKKARSDPAVYWVRRHRAFSPETDSEDESENESEDDAEDNFQDDSEDGFEYETEEEEMTKVESKILDQEEDGDGEVKPANICHSPFQHQPSQTHCVRRSKRLAGPIPFTQRLLVQKCMDDFKNLNKFPVLLAIPGGPTKRLKSMDELSDDARANLTFLHKELQERCDPTARIYNQIQGDPEESIKKCVCVNRQLLYLGKSGKVIRPETYDLGGEYGVTADDDCISKGRLCVHVRKHNGAYALYIVPLPANERKGICWKELEFWILGKV